MISIMHWTEPYLYMNCFCKSQFTDMNNGRRIIRGHNILDTHSFNLRTMNMSDAEGLSRLDDSSI